MIEEDFRDFVCDGDGLARFLDFFGDDILIEEDIGE